MHPLPAGVFAAAGSLWGMLRKHGPKRKTDRAGVGPAVHLFAAHRRGGAVSGVPGGPTSWPGGFRRERFPSGCQWAGGPTHILLSGSEPAGSPNIIVPSCLAGKRARPISRTVGGLPHQGRARVARRFPKVAACGSDLSGWGAAGLAHGPTQALGADPARLPFPQVHQQLPGKGHNGLFAPTLGDLGI